MQVSKYHTTSNTIPSFYLSLNKFPTSYDLDVLRFSFISDSTISFHVFFSSASKFNTLYLIIFNSVVIHNYTHRPTGTHTPF